MLSNNGEYFIRYEVPEFISRNIPPLKRVPSIFSPISSNCSIVLASFLNIGLTKSFCSSDLREFTIINKTRSVVFMYFVITTKI